MPRRAGDVATLPSPLAGEGGVERSETPGEGAGSWVEAEWPEADVIVGNPPFLGGKLLRNGSRTRNGTGSPGLGDEYVDRLFALYDGRVRAESDLVCYWFEKARAQLKAGKATRVGLVATNSIRGGANRDVLGRIAADTTLFEAWADEEWTIDGAAVRVSLVCFGATAEGEGSRLNGLPVDRVHADLSAAAVDLTRARRLIENAGVAFMGDTKGGAFDIPGELARAWLRAPLNPNGRPNSDVLRPWINGLDVTRRPRDMWIIDFGWAMGEREASLYEAPWEYAVEHVKPERLENRRASLREILVAARRAAASAAGETPPSSPVRRHGPCQSAPVVFLDAEHGHSRFSGVRFRA